MSGVISLNPLFIKSMSLTSERFIRRKACRRLNPLFIKSMSLTVWRGCGNMTGSAWSQSFIHQVYVSHAAFQLLRLGLLNVSILYSSSLCLSRSDMREGEIWTLKIVSILYSSSLCLSLNKRRPRMKVKFKVAILYSSSLCLSL